MSEHIKKFDKMLFFSNVRELLRQKPDIRIGQIEKEAGVRLGYMSRLEKRGNKSEPKIEFIATAAKIFEMSIDTLISIDFAAATPTEKYLIKFLDRVKERTLKDELDWSKDYGHFSLQLRNYTKLYLYGEHEMKYLRICPNYGDDEKLVIASQDKTLVAPVAKSLYLTVKEWVERPAKISKDVTRAINSFMRQKNDK